MINVNDIILSPVGIAVDGVLSNYPDSIYVGQAPLKTKSGFADSCADIFYTANPDTSKGHKTYFGVFIRNIVNPKTFSKESSVFITDASHVESLRFNFVKLPNGKYIYSRYQHDFRQFDNGCFVDGGSWLQQPDGSFAMWGRTSIPSEYESFEAKIVSGKFVKCA